MRKSRPCGNLVDAKNVCFDVFPERVGFPDDTRTVGYELALSGIHGASEVSKLADVLKDPGSYQGREVVLEGNYGYYCCPSDFSYREGMEGIGVAPAGFDSPKADRGRPVRIYGVVRLGGIPGEEEADENEEESIRQDLYIEAKGVQLR